MRCNPGTTARIRCQIDAEKIAKNVPAASDSESLWLVQVAVATTLRLGVSAFLLGVLLNREGSGPPAGKLRDSRRPGAHRHAGLGRMREPRRGVARTHLQACRRHHGPHCRRPAAAAFAAAVAASATPGPDVPPGHAGPAAYVADGARPYSDRDPAAAGEAETREELEGSCPGKLRDSRRAHWHA